jgi:hypothetical protein
MDDTEDWIGLPTELEAEPFAELTRALVAEKVPFRWEKLTSSAKSSNVTYALWFERARVRDAAQVIVRVADLADPLHEEPFTGACPACGAAVAHARECPSCALVFHLGRDADDALIVFLREHGGF